MVDGHVFARNDGTWAASSYDWPPSSVPADFNLLDFIGGMRSLRQGVASYFKKTLHPAGTARQTKLQIVARGALPDGGRFFVQANACASRSDGAFSTRNDGE